MNEVLGSRGVLCGRCEHLNPPASETCEKCGEELFVACDRCGFRNERALTYCRKCRRELPLDGWMNKLRRLLQR